MEGLRLGRSIQVILGSAFIEGEGQPRLGVISQIVDADKGLICAHVNLLPPDIGLDVEEVKGTLLASEICDTRTKCIYFGLSGFFVNVPYSEGKEPETWHYAEPQATSMNDVSLEIRPNPLTPGLDDHFINGRKVSRTEYAVFARRLFLEAAIGHQVHVRVEAAQGQKHEEKDTAQAQQAEERHGPTPPRLVRVSSALSQEAPDA